MKARSENGNVQTRTGIFVPPIRRVVYAALAVAAATTVGIGGPACADPPARDVEDGSVLGDAELRLSFEPSLDLGALDEPDSASGWVIEGGPYLHLAGIDGEALVAGVTATVRNGPFDSSCNSYFPNERRSLCPDTDLIWHPVLTVRR